MTSTCMCNKAFQRGSTPHPPTHPHFTPTTPLSCRRPRPRSHCHGHYRRRRRRRCRRRRRRSWVRMNYQRGGRWPSRWRCARPQGPRQSRPTGTAPTLGSHQRWRRLSCRLLRRLCHHHLCHRHYCHRHLCRRRYRSQNHHQHHRGAGRGRSKALAGAAAREPQDRP